jgi:hypothetical protein
MRDGSEIQYTSLHMKLCFSLLALSGLVLSAQSPNLSGVWKANLEKSKMAGPPPTNYLTIIDQQDGKLTQTTGVYGQRGEQRSSFSVNTDGKQSRNSFRGMPMQTTGTWNGPVLVLESKVAAQKPTTMTEKYTLSPDGKTLTVETVSSSNGKDTQQTIVLEKQPDSAGEDLRKPEQLASAHYKNVKVLKDVPASQFMDNMRYFTMALGTNCEQCHVQGNFAADDKPEKATARKMIAMTHKINAENFDGKAEVQCFTCHKGQTDPQSHPAF